MPDVLTTESTTLGDAFERVERVKVVRCESCGTRLVTESHAAAHLIDVHGYSVWDICIWIWRSVEGTASA